MEKSIYMKEEKLFNAFRMFDADGSGKISAEELKNALGSIYFIICNIFITWIGADDFKSVDKNYWDNMIKEVDKNNDGEVHLISIKL